MSRMSEERRAKRKLLQLRKKGRLGQKVEQLYADCTGTMHKKSYIARMYSFCKIIDGCMHNGFPIVVKHLWYNAWACWPFFFVRSNIEGDPIPLLNHERIHVRQQWDIHVAISFPLFVLFEILEFLGYSNIVWALLVLPFIPTIFYGIAMIFSYRNLLLRDTDRITFTMVRANTCFEREAISHQLNAEYLLNRKFMAVLAYTDIKKFRNYGL